MLSSGSIEPEHHSLGVGDGGYERQDEEILVFHIVVMRPDASYVKDGLLSLVATKYQHRPESHLADRILQCAPVILPLILPTSMSAPVIFYGDRTDI